MYIFQKVRLLKNLSDGTLKTTKIKMEVCICKLNIKKCVKFQKKPEKNSFRSTKDHADFKNSKNLVLSYYSDSILSWLVVY